MSIQYAASNCVLLRSPFARKDLCLEPPLSAAPMPRELPAAPAPPCIPPNPSRKPKKLKSTPKIVFGGSQGTAVEITGLERKTCTAPQPEPRAPLRAPRRDTNQYLLTLTHLRKNHIALLHCFGEEGPLPNLAIFGPQSRAQTS